MQQAGPAQVARAVRAGVRRVGVVQLLARVGGACPLHQICSETYTQRLRLNEPPPEAFEILATLHLTSRNLN